MSHTPAPLNWLASEQAHLLGRIERLKRAQAKLIGQVSGHQAALVATVRRLTLVEAQISTLSKQAKTNISVSHLHPVPFEMEQVKPKQTHINPYLLPRGKMSETIMGVVWKNGGTATTDQILERIMDLAKAFPANRSYVKKRVLIRLWIMVAAGKLRPDNSTPGTRNRSWHLPL